MADGRQNNGGKRSGAGRKPSLNPIAAVRLRDPDLQAKLAAVTRHERDVSKDDSISQEQLVAMLIEEAHREMLAFQAVATPTIDSLANQFPATAMIDSPNNQSIVANRPTAATMAYQLVISIEEVTPRIWRRLVVTSDTTLAQLHTYLQIAFEWGDYHLHEFRLHGEECDEAMTLGQLGVRHGDLFDYVYDFGDYWLHTIEIEASTPMNARARYPRCTGGAQPGPEEDSGGFPKTGTITAGQGGEKAHEKCPRNGQTQEKALDEPADIQSSDRESTIGGILCRRSVLCECMIDSARNQFGVLSAPTQLAPKMCSERAC